MRRENEITNFTAVSSYKVVAFFINNDGKIFKSELPQKFKTNEEAYSFMIKCKDATFSVESFEESLPELKPILPVHYEELALDKNNIPFFV